MGDKPLSGIEVKSIIEIPAVTLYQRLRKAFEVSAVYKVSFSRNLSQDVLDVIAHIKGDLNPQDIIPNFPTSLSLIVKTPGNIDKVFHQDSNTYMEAFDEYNFKKFALECLKLISTSPT
jgi:hypothetical protein